MDLCAQARARWAYRMVERCSTPPPAYGSAEWLQLPENDLRRIAAVVIAAEAWASSGDCLEETLRAQVEAERHAHKRAEDADYCARRDAHRENWDATAARFLPDPDAGDRIEAEFRNWLAGGAA